MKTLKKREFRRGTDYPKRFSQIPQGTYDFSGGFICGAEVIPWRALEEETRLSMQGWDRILKLYSWDRSILEDTWGAPYEPIRNG